MPTTQSWITGQEGKQSGLIRSRSNGRWKVTTMNGLAIDKERMGWSSLEKKDDA